jgi:hypothetical protein
MKKQVNLLKKLGAPQQLIDSFVEVCEINSQLPEDMRSDFPTLLEEQCRKFGFHDILPDGWLFRPYASAGANHRNDTAVMGAEPEAPTIEQAYRRGVAQGFSLCRQLVRDKREMDIERHEKRIAGRKRSVQRQVSSRQRGASRESCSEADTQSRTRSGGLSFNATSFGA